MIELKGKPVAENLYNEITAGLKTWSEKKWSMPHLAVVLVGEDPASHVYVSHKQKACEKLGFRSSLIKLSENISEHELSLKLRNLNSDDDIDGILLQLPLPEHLNARQMMEKISIAKDVDGLTQAALGALMVSHQQVASCTPAGIIEILKYYQIDVSGKNVVVVGRSTIVGLPLFHLLNQLNATVTLCHSKTPNLKQILKSAQYVFVAVGKPNIFNATDFAEGATIIDVGIHRIEGKIIGDVNLQDGEGYLSAATPVPGGVGPMTIAMLMKNTYILAEKNRKIKQ